MKKMTPHPQTATAFTAVAAAAAKHARIARIARIAQAANIAQGAQPKKARGRPRQAKPYRLAGAAAGGPTPHFPTARVH